MVTHKSSLSSRYLLFKLNVTEDNKVDESKLDLNNNNSGRSGHYYPGDHVAVFPVNDPKLVDEVMDNLMEKPSEDEVIRMSGIFELVVNL